MSYIFETVTGNASALAFNFNGQVSIKNYDVEIVNGNRLKVVSTQNEMFSLLEADVSEVEINGTVYSDPLAAQFALKALVSSTNEPVVMTKEMYLQLSAAVQAVDRGKILPDTPVPSGGWLQGWYTPGLFENAEPGTNYPHQNNLKAKKGFITKFLFNGTVWDSVAYEMPQATNSIIRFSDSTFPLVAPATPSASNPPIQRTHNNSIWQLADGQTANVGNVPGISAKWVSLGSRNLRIYEDLTPGTILNEKEQVISNNVTYIVKDGQTATVGVDLPTDETKYKKLVVGDVEKVYQPLNFNSINSPSNNNKIYFNNYPTYTGKVTKFLCNGNGNIQIYKANSNYSNVVLLQNLNLGSNSGIKNISVDIDLNNERLGISANGATVRYSTLTAGQVQVAESPNYVLSNALILGYGYNYIEDGIETRIESLEEEIENLPSPILPLNLFDENNDVDSATMKATDEFLFGKVVTGQNFDYLQNLNQMNDSTGSASAVTAYYPQFPQKNFRQKITEITLRGSGTLKIYKCKSDYSQQTFVGDFVCNGITVFANQNIILEANERLGVSRNTGNLNYIHPNNGFQVYEIEANDITNISVALNYKALQIEDSSTVGKVDERVLEILAETPISESSLELYQKNKLKFQKSKGNFNTMPNVYFQGRWFEKQISGVNHICTINQGAEFYALVRGTTQLTALFTDQSDGGTNTPVIAVSVDGGDFQRITIQNSTQIVSGLTTDEHIIRIVVDGLQESLSKWTGEIGLAFKGFTVDVGGEVVAIKPKNKVINSYGHSMVEGINVLGTGANPTVNSAHKAYSFVMSDILNAVNVRVGFGATGVTHSGSGGVPEASVYISKMTSTRFENAQSPDVIVFHHGVNDSQSSNFSVKYKEAIDKLMINYPCVPIFCLREFNGTFASQVSTIVNSYIDKNVYFVDTTGWGITFSDGLHPDEAGNQIAGEKLAEFILSKLGKNFFIK